MFSNMARSARTVIFILALMVSVNSSVFFANRTLLPITSTAALKQGTPYKYDGPRTEWTSAVDPYGSYNASHAYDLYSASVLRDGEIPYWNPYQGLGQPFLANYLSSVFYPVNFLHLILPNGYWDIVNVINWLLIALFTHAFLRLVGVDRVAALISSATIFGSGYAQIYVSMREVMAVAAWWPLLMYAVERCIQEPGWRHRHIVLALGVFCSIAGGQPEVTFVSLFSVLLYALTRAYGSGISFVNSIVAVLPGGLAGLLLATPIWLNFAEYAFFSAYSFHPAGEGVGLRHIRAESIATFFFPYIYGRLQTTPYGIISGWHWDISPGWFPALGIFFLMGAIGSLNRHRPPWLLFFLITSFVVFGKIWGFPILNEIGRLPIFDRTVYPRYAGFLLMIPFSAIAAYGAMSSAKWSLDHWKFHLRVWYAIVAVVFLVGIIPVWTVLSAHSFNSIEVRTFFLYSVLGLMWAIALPTALFIAKKRNPSQYVSYYFLSIVGILLQSVAYSSNGYSDNEYLILSLVAITCFLLFFLSFANSEKYYITHGNMCVGLVLIALIPIMASVFFEFGLPKRYDPLTKPPYLPVLERLQENNLYRAYSLDGSPFPNFSAPLHLANVTNLDALTITNSAEFSLRYLDAGTPPIWFAGNFSPRSEDTTAYGELRRNARFFELIGARYLVTDKSDPRQLAFDNVSPSASMIPRVLEKTIASTFISDQIVELREIEILLGTFGRVNPGTLVLSVFDGDARTLLRQSAVDTSQLKDNSFHKFSFPQIDSIKNKRIYMELKFTPSSKGSLVATYIHRVDDAEQFVFRIFDQKNPYESIYEDPETGIEIWENKSVGPRVFFAPFWGRVVSSKVALDRMVDSIDLRRKVWLESDEGPDLNEESHISAVGVGHLNEFRISPNDVWITYQAVIPGILTLTDSYAEGWRATVNGVDVPVLRVNGVFRGVKINKIGEVNVHFSYRPPYWTTSQRLALFGLAMLIAACLISFRRIGHGEA